MTNEEIKKFLYNWMEHPMRTEGRKDLDETDKIWNMFYENLMLNKDKEILFQGDLLYRVLTGGITEPQLINYDEYKENQEEIFGKDHDFWLKQNDIKAVKFDNHWVSFTDSIDVINSGYFAEKNLRGFVIVIKPEKAINIHCFKNYGFDEREVVAPMDKSTLVEILPFNEFIMKYKK